MGKGFRNGQGKGIGERQGQGIGLVDVWLCWELGDQGLIYPGRVAGNTFFVREGSRRNAKKTFCPRRATKDHEENLLSAKGREGQLLIRGGLGGTPFFHEGPLRTTKKTFCPRRGREGQLLIRGGLGGIPFFHEGPLRTTKKTFCPRRAAKNIFIPFFHEGLRRTALHLFGPRRAPTRGAPTGWGTAVDNGWAGGCLNCFSPVAKGPKGGISNGRIMGFGDGLQFGLAGKGGWAGRHVRGRGGRFGTAGMRP